VAKASFVTDEVTRSSGPRAGRVALSLGAGLGAVSLAVAAWASMGKEAPPQSKADLAAAKPAPAAAQTAQQAPSAPAPTPAPAPAPTFAEQCDASLRLRDASLSIARCTPFIADPALAPQANAALAVAYMFQDPPDAKQSAVHAAAAADAGNFTGSTLLAMHALRGDAGVSMSIQSIWGILQRAANMPQLRGLHEQVGAALRCREAAQFRWRDQPMFCLLRTEIQAWARDNSLPALKSTDAWTDRFRVTGGLPGIRALEVAYDRDPTTGLFTPAALQYELDGGDEASNPALQDITAALDAKYRRGARGGSTWIAADGVSITLQRNGPAMTLRYELPQRVEAARRHAAEEALQLSKARVEKAKAVL